MRTPTCVLLVTTLLPASIACGGPGGTHAGASGGSGAMAGSGAAASTGGAGNAGGSQNMGGAAGGGGTPALGGAAGTSSSGGGGGVPSGIDAPVPPAGTKLCGSGTFTQAESTAACSAAPTTSALNPGFPQKCDLVDDKGGKWEAYCGATALEYVWVWFDSLSVAATCVLIPDFAFSTNELQSGNSGASSGLTQAKPEVSATSLVSGAGVGWHFTYFNGVGASGKGHAWIAVHGDCGGPPTPTDVKATALGFTYSWGG